VRIRDHVALSAEIPSEELVLAEPAGQRRVESLIRRHAVLIRRLVLFNAIGLFVLIAGIGVQWAMVGPTGVTWSYAIQAIFSIELSYLLNRYLTWRDRKAGSISLLKWHLQRAMSTVPNFLGYALLLHLGMNWLAANLTVTAAFIIVNYVVGDRWTFAQKKVKAAAVSGLEERRPPISPGWQPSVSVVIPVKDNAGTIRATVQAILGQDYSELAELLVVGDFDDSTWDSLEDITDPRLVLLEHPYVEGRDANAKRYFGLTKARSEVLALADSDIVMPPDWLSSAIHLLNMQGGGVVCGVMRSISKGFWGSFVDHNILAAKTPRAEHAYRVTAETCGRKTSKLPVTASAVFTRDVFEAEPIDPGWTVGGYEDYEWFWRVARRRLPILVSPSLVGRHHHRSGKSLFGEYKRSARACACFIRSFPDCPLARKRLLQGILLPPLFLSLVAGACWVAAAGYGLYVAVAAGVDCVALIGRELLRTRRLEAIAYPFVGLSLAAAFTLTLTRSLIVARLADTTVTRTWESTTGALRTAWLSFRVNWPLAATRSLFVAKLTDADATVARSWERMTAAYRTARVSFHINRPLAAIVALQAILSLTLVWSNTAFGDEANYLWTGRLEWAHWLHGAAIPNFSGELSGAPQIYPPIGAVASAAGGLAGARILSLAFMLIASILLYQITRRLFDNRTALVAAALWAVSEPVLRLTFATFDALACLFLILSAWLAIRSADSLRRRGELVALSALSLALGGVTAFAFAIYIPFVVLFAFFAWQYLIGTKAALWCTGWLGASGVALTVALMTFGHEWTGVLRSTINRSVLTRQGLALVSTAAWSWDGLLLGLALAGCALAFATRDRRRWLLASTVLAGLIVPLYQAHLGTAFSMDKHMSAGTALLAVAAGFTFSRFRPSGLSKPAIAAMSAALIMVPAISGIWYARSTFHDWPNFGLLLAATRRAGIATNGNPVLVDSLNGTFSVYPFEYYLMKGDNWQHWQDDPSKYISGVRNGTYSAAILCFNSAQLASPKLPSGALNGREVAAQVVNLAAQGSDQLVQALATSGRYRIVDVIPYQSANKDESPGIFVIWKRG
jgi:putative flippase GtrA